jgi:hypothetical protein
MSSLLKEAIIDAKALKEAALKNAESTIIDKYSEEVKEMVENILEEQDEAPLGELPEPMTMDDAPESDTVSEDNVEVTDDTIPLASTNDLSDLEGAGLDEMPSDSDSIEFDVDLGVLEEAIKALSAELEEDVEEELNEEEEELDEEIDIELAEEEELEEEAPRKDPRAPRKVAKEPKGYMNAADDREFCRRNPNDPKCFYTIDSPTVAKDKKMARSYPPPTAGGPQGFGESYDADELIDAIMEKLTVDMGADLAGWAGRSSEDQMHEMEKELAHRRSTDVEEELEALKSAQEDLVFEKKNLDNKVEDYKNVVENLRENLQDVNLSNARLLYTNRVLRNTSLNERQKEKIVEAISTADSVTEAKTIFETLQSTVEAKPTQRPQSLSEAIGSKRTSVIRATRQESTPSDPLSERMKRLAGIK